LVWWGLGSLKKRRAFYVEDIALFHILIVTPVTTEIKGK
jgi:hypothetical protein